MISDRKCAGVARCLVEMLTGARANIRFAVTAPRSAAGQMVR